MKVDDIPQDESKTYHGHQKIIYGTRDGHYEAATSSGWQDEAFATEQAVAELDELTEQALQAVLKGERSPLYYYMYRYRHDESSLAQSAGLWRWQIRRHFRPEVFAKLNNKTLSKYAQALQLDVSTLRQPLSDGLEP
ncbi:MULTISPECIES: hypothetical protein [unclassified Neisseria]|uniref:hypothetical protein n=1 Tax=unclassified Neisseria TaxID=2623750 RepID=UPI002666399E|nr:MULTISPECIES: hypothetical protein [unclassified Neisseria]MDO1508873.1 hypothetical protein [Neisseria sp. MVDL19-042950]MDO1515132.1 hypothetical protein [Neisseria sp. MVDL18-041461]MDO1562492.1 hypothetical protein [Neisseria sp. MVDL20-010259]